MKSEQRRLDAVRMLEACGVDPHDIPRDTPFDRNGDEVTLLRYVRDTSGAILRDADGEPREEGFTIRPPADAMPSWLV